MKVSNQVFDEERALYGIHDAEVMDCTFDGPADGESALKETHNISVYDCLFRLRYPFWHTTNTTIVNSSLTETCRAALWYDKDINISESILHGIKALRESEKIALTKCDIISDEFLWRCSDIVINDCKMESVYPFFECKNIQIDKLEMKAKYSFQYVENAVIHNSVFNTKDAFWHSKNVTVYDSEINGEYLGWYSEGLHLVRCHICGTQPLCYCKGLVLEDCTMEKADFSFENSEVEATVNSGIVSVKNPVNGFITAESIGEIIIDEFIRPGSNCVITDKSKR